MAQLLRVLAAFPEEQSSFLTPILDNSLATEAPGRGFPRLELESKGMESTGVLTPRND